MSVQRPVRIECDWVGFGTAPIRILRTEGWTTVGGADYCPQHAAVPRG